MAAHFKLKNLKCELCVMHLEYDESTESVVVIISAVSEIGYTDIPRLSEASSTKTSSTWSKLFR